MIQSQNKIMDDAEKIKLKRKEDELKLECLEHENPSLAEMKDKKWSCSPQNSF